MLRSVTDVDYLIIGGGFYGCCLALYLRSISKNVLLIEASDTLMNRASRVNQARIHTGFHYPRSILTAVKSMVLHQRFLRDFPEAVVDNFQMLYAIPKRRSKVSTYRFYRMFRDILAPIMPASPEYCSLFNDDMIESVFVCDESAFDYRALEKLLSTRLGTADVDVRLSTELVHLADSKTKAIATLSDGSEVTAKYAFNVTYSQVNAVLDMAELPRAHLKHEMAELAIVKPPSELEDIGVTVMDGPFFSCMPYPAENFYSLTHVRYTPHHSWIDLPQKHAPSNSPPAFPAQSRVMHMIKDSQRYLPCLAQARYEKSLFEIKTVLIKNETDDGRPILYQRKPSNSRVISILGGKIDNVYDLFDLVRKTSSEFSDANDNFVIGRKP